MATHKVYDIQWGGCSPAEVKNVPHARIHPLKKGILLQGRYSRTLLESYQTSYYYPQFLFLFNRNSLQRTFSKPSRPPITKYGFGFYLRFCNVSYWTNKQELVLYIPNDMILCNELIQKNNNSLSSYQLKKDGTITD